MTDININVNYNHIFMTIIFAIGAILTTVSWDIDSKLEDKNCQSTSLKTTNKLALMIGVIFLTSSLSFFGCSYRCQNVMSGFNLITYIIILTILGLALIIIGTTISASSIGNCSNYGSPSSIWGLGVIIVITSIIYFYITYKNTIKF